MDKSEFVERVMSEVTRKKIEKEKRKQAQQISDIVSLEITRRKRRRRKRKRWTQ